VVCAEAVVEDDFVSTRVDNYDCYTTSFPSEASVSEGAVAASGALEFLACGDF
jgi:hypothetical protein